MAQQDNSNWNQRGQTSPEASYGAGGYGTYFWKNTKLGLAPELDMNDYSGEGQKVTSTLQSGDEHSEGDYSCPGSFTELVLPFDGILKSVNPGVAGSDGQFTRVYTPDPYGPDTVKTYVHEKGNGRINKKFGFVFFSDFSLNLTRKSANATGKVMGQQMGFQTAMTPKTIPVPAAWATATVYPLGALVRKTGTAPNPLLYFRVIAKSGTGTSGTPEPTWPTTAGATVIDNAGANQLTWRAELPSNIPNVLIVPKDISVYWSLVSFADLALETNKFSRYFDYTLNLGGRFGEFYPMDDAKDSYGGITEKKMTANIHLKVGADVNDTQTDYRDPISMTNIRNNTIMFIRAKCLGPLIGGTTYNKLTIDTCVQLRPPKDDDENGLAALGVDAEVIPDPATDKFLEATLVNTLPNIG